MPELDTRPKYSDEAKSFLRDQGLALDSRRAIYECVDLLRIAMTECGVSCGVGSSLDVLNAARWHFLGLRDAKDNECDG